MTDVSAMASTRQDWVYKIGPPFSYWAINLVGLAPVLKGLTKQISQMNCELETSILERVITRQVLLLTAGDQTNKNHEKLQMAFFILSTNVIRSTNRQERRHEKR